MANYQGKNCSTKLSLVDSSTSEKNIGMIFHDFLIHSLAITIHYELKQQNCCRMKSKNLRVLLKNTLFHLGHHFFRQILIAIFEQKPNKKERNAENRSHFLS